ncbi:MAG: efflux RND transporter periplasmic adaptor subunit [Nitrosomonas sp.]|nr:efflux RND transporter periplasmic adaptor subunit [Nitrosomonas sp.]
MKFRYTISILILIPVFFTVACGNKTDTTNATEKAATDQSYDPNRITLNPDMMQRIKVGQLKPVKLADSILVPSQIRVDEQKLVRVGANVTGRIVDMYADIGDSVKAGATLASISSPDLNRAQLDYLRDHSMNVLAEQALQRAKLLLEADVIGVAEFQRREAENLVSRAELSAAKDNLQVLGLNLAAINKLVNQGVILPKVPITVSKSGTVIERNVIVGQVVQPSDRLFKVADLSTVWVVGDVPEQVATNVMVGQHVEILVPALNDAVYDGLIVLVADTVNPLTRTVMVRSVVENSDRKLKPSMLASMRIIEESREQLVIPETAVVRETNRDYVYIAEGQNQFLRVPVELGMEINNMRPVLMGLSEGQHIVVDGAYDIDNERQLRELE